MDPINCHLNTDDDDEEEDDDDEEEDEEEEFLFALFFFLTFFDFVALFLLTPVFNAVALRFLMPGMVLSIVLVRTVLCKQRDIFMYGHGEHFVLSYIFDISLSS